MIFEAIPNFSEGRRPGICQDLRTTVEQIPGLTVADQHIDEDHHRTVLTFLGEKEALAEGAFRLAEKAIEKIDLTRHTGEHPRMGAIDVLPFVPLGEATMEMATLLARTVGKRIGEELHLPVFLYESAAQRPERKNLADIRRPRFEGYRDYADLDPDFGPSQVHPTAGCVAVGARPILIAYNIDLQTDQVGIAQKIAQTIREKNGGKTGIKAIGLGIDQRGCAQVSMNVCNYRATSLLEIFGEVKKLAEEFGSGIRSSEIVGLCPQEALPKAAKETLQLENFEPKQLLENHLP